MMKMPPPDDVLAMLTNVVRSERASLARIARAEGVSAEDAVDCVQDAFCTFLQASIGGNLPDPDMRAAYLGGIVRNTARNKRRRHHLAREHEPIDRLVAHGAESADAMIALAEDHVRLRACVERLCDTQRAVVTLRLLEERDGEDVAHTLGITRGYVDVLLHRAKGSLLVCMRDELIENRT